MMELGCARTHDARPCVSWGGSTTAPAAAGCAASVGEAVGWCWVDEGHTDWAYCEPNCRWEEESPGHFNLRDPEKFPVLDEAARHLHAAEPDVESARKVLSKAVDASHSVIEQHWLNGGKSKVRPEISFHLDQTRQTFAGLLTNLVFTYARRRAKTSAARLSRQHTLPSSLLLSLRYTPPPPAVRQHTQQ